MGMELGITSGDPSEKLKGWHSVPLLERLMDSH